MCLRLILSLVTQLKQNQTKTTLVGTLSHLGTHVMRDSEAEGDPFSVLFSSKEFKTEKLFRFRQQLHLKHSLSLTPVSDMLSYSFLICFKASWQKKNIIIKFMDFLKWNEPPLIFITSGYYLVERILSCPALLHIHIPWKSILAVQGICHIICFQGTAKALNLCRVTNRQDSKVKTQWKTRNNVTDLLLLWLQGFCVTKASELNTSFNLKWKCGSTGVCDLCYWFQRWQDFFHYT